MFLKSNKIYTYICFENLKLVIIYIISTSMTEIIRKFSEMKIFKNYKTFPKNNSTPMLKYLTCIICR